jgi:signal transduction histidine kinase
VPSPWPPWPWPSPPALAEVLVADRLRRAAAEVETWLRQEHHRALRLPPGGGWRELESALNALGAAYQRRGIKLRRERPWRRELVDSLVSPALLVSAEDRLLAANDAARALLGISDDARTLTVLEASGSPALAGAVHEARDTGVPVTLDVEHGERDLRCVVSLVGDELLVILTDRTQERRVEELRRNFVVNASHELKTPVTSIRTLSEALEVTARQDPEQVGPLVARLSGEAERLARLVYDLLDLRRLEERAPVETDPVDLAWLVRDVAAELVDRAERREVELGVEAPDRLVLAGSEGDLRIVVKNLVANAIQYNRPSGSVEVVLTATPEGAVLSVARHRHRHPGARPPAHLRALLPGRCGALAGDRRDGAGPVAGPPRRRAARRHDHRRQRAGGGDHLHRPLPAGAGAGSDAQ